MSRFSWRITCLLSLPLLVLLVPLLFKHEKREVAIGHENGGGWKNDATGERVSLGVIHLNLKRYPESNLFTANYTVPEADSKYMKEVGRGTRPDIEWAYYLEYRRHEKTLVKSLYTDTRPPEKPNKIWRWRNVSEDAIHRVAAPIGALKYVSKIEAYKGGNLTGLRRFGAVLEEQKQR